jgi:uncharacterized protein YjbI with pentapeptide repeats
MPLRHIKPQAALVATTRTQIGSTPMLAISVGVGFRLTDPAILVHETAVWEALKAAAPSVPLTEAAMPKRCAEWLLAGHAVQRAPAGAAGRAIDWAAWVELDGVRKTVSCRATVDEQAQSAGLVRLAIDPTRAAAGRSRENPLGVASGSAPLQRVSALGVGPDPLAAMGVLGSDWPERHQWMPSRPGTVEAMARDGTHMGWPEHVDLRYFQLAAPDQWSRHDSWTPGARFELGGFGERGEGYAGTLPRLAAVALTTRTDRPGFEQVPLRQQTVWLLPDHDLGVLWWNGAVQTDYVLDDSPAMLVAAFKDANEPIDADMLMAFAARRADLTQVDLLKHADEVLMPAIERNWVWELILARTDHPRFAPPPRTREEVGARLASHRQSLVDAQQGRARLQAFKEEAQQMAPPVVPPDGIDWRQRFDQADSKALSDVTIRGADLTALRLDGWHFENVRFEACRLDRSTWRHCRLVNVFAVDCGFADTAFDDLAWTGGAMTRGELARGAWRDVVLEQLHLEDCGLDDLSVAGGSWSMVSVKGRGGSGGVVEDTRWKSVAWNGVKAPRWTWNRISADSLGLVECDMVGLTLSHCTLRKSSALLSDLSAGTWRKNVLSLVVLSHGTSIDRTVLCDCSFKSSSFQNLHAASVQVEHCSFLQFNAQHMKAEHSSWTCTLLDGANVTHASLAGASFDRCSLKEAMLYGTDLRETRMRDCNLIRARTSWAHLPEAGAWRGNLSLGLLEVPRREQ